MARQPQPPCRDEQEDTVAGGQFYQLDKVTSHPRGGPQGFWCHTRTATSGRRRVRAWQAIINVAARHHSDRMAEKEMKIGGRRPKSNRDHPSRGAIYVCVSGNRMESGTI